MSWNRDYRPDWEHLPPPPPWYWGPMDKPGPRGSGLSETLETLDKYKKEIESFEDYLKKREDKDKHKHKEKMATAAEKRDLALLMILLMPLYGIPLMFMYIHAFKYLAKMATG